MGLGKGFWPSLWFVQGVLEVIFIPGSTIAWIFLAVATVYWLLKIMQNGLPGSIRLPLGALTGVLWIVSFFFLF
jgi:hypothetical protein